MPQRVMDRPREHTRCCSCHTQAGQAALLHLNLSWLLPSNSSPRMTRARCKKERGDPLKGSGWVSQPKPPGTDPTACATDANVICMPLCQPLVSATGQRRSLPNNGDMTSTAHHCSHPSWAHVASVCLGAHTQPAPASNKEVTRWKQGRATTTDGSPPGPLPADRPSPPTPKRQPRGGWPDWAGPANTLPVGRPTSMMHKEMMHKEMKCSWRQALRRGVV